jgi:hypothetical protein
MIKRIRGIVKEIKNGCTGAGITLLTQTCNDIDAFPFPEACPPMLMLTHEEWQKTQVMLCPQDLVPTLMHQSHISIAAST